MPKTRAFNRWIGLTAPAIRFIGPASLLSGMMAALLLAATLGSSAESAIEGARSVRLAWLAWLIGLAGVCEDRHDGRQVIAPVAAPQILAHRIVLGAALSGPIGALCLLLSSRSGAYLPLGRLLAEMTAMYLVAAGVSGVARHLAPAGFTSLVATVALVGGLVSELVLPVRWRLWPSPPDHAINLSLPLVWLAFGAVALAAAFGFAMKEWRLPGDEHA